MGIIIRSERKFNSKFFKNFKINILIKKQIKHKKLISLINNFLKIFINFIN